MFVRRVLFVVVFASWALSPIAAAEASPCWRPPVVGEVVDPFRQPACTWCAGNRGIEYRVGADSSVRAAATGVVTFSGSVAGVGYLVIRSAGGYRHTYGRLESILRERGHVVVAGSLVGVASGSFHFGVRRDDTYVDPAPLLGELVGRWRLVPTDGRRARPSPDPELRCQARSVPR